MISFKSLQAKHDGVKRELDSTAAELGKVKVEQGVAIEQYVTLARLARQHHSTTDNPHDRHATRLKTIETEHEAERASFSRQLRDIDVQSKELLSAK